jgi:hypothetical protein
MEENMILIFENREIINLDNVAVIEAAQNSDGEVEVLIVTTAVKFYTGDHFFEPQHYNAYCKKFVIKNDKWFELLDTLKQERNTFVCSEPTEELNT